MIYTDVSMLKTTFPEIPFVARENASSMFTDSSTKCMGLGWSLMSLLILLLVVGCSSGDRKGLRGTVTLDGEALSDGSIAFRPQRGTSGPTAGANIFDGEFVVKDDGGTFKGRFDVLINASRKTGRQVENTLTGTMIDEYESIIPTTYNSETELNVEVTDEKNEFNFELKSE